MLVKTILAFTYSARSGDRGNLGKTDIGRSPSQLDAREKAVSGGKAREKRLDLTQMPQITQAVLMLTIWTVVKG